MVVNLGHFYYSLVVVWNVNRPAWYGFSWLIPGLFLSKSNQSAQCKNSKINKPGKINMFCTSARLIQTCTTNWV